MKPKTPTTAAEDYALVQSYVHGNSKAFDTIRKQYEATLNAFCYKLMGNIEDAHDLRQNTWLKACSHFDQFRGDSRLGTWLFRIAINEARTAQVKASRCIVENLASRTSPVTETSFDLSAEQSYLNKELMNLIQKAFGTLTPKNRSVMELHFFNGFDYAEIARRLSISRKNVKGHIFIGTRAVSFLLRQYYAA